MIRANVFGVVFALRRKATALRSVRVDAAGAAAARVAQELLAAARDALSGHSRTGNAAASLAATGGPGGAALQSAGYLRYQPWWPFRAGLPAELLDRAATIYREEAACLLGS